MAAIPITNIEELKEASGSNQLNECFQFLFVQEHHELEAFFNDIAKKFNNLRDKIKKHEQTLIESKSLGQFHVVATDAHRFLMESQLRDQGRLKALSAILAELREATTEKKRHIILMGYEDDYDV